MAEKGRNSFCGSPAHALDRRRFLGTMAAGAAAFAADMTVLDLLREPALAGALKAQQKHVILLWLAGGASQLETWDPKPGAVTGGPFQSIQTSVPGTLVSEHMPLLAERAHLYTIVRTCKQSSTHHQSAGYEALLRERFMAEARRLQRAETALGQTLFGPQRDDVTICYQGRESRGYASQGEQRLAAFLLVAALALAIQRQHGHRPVGPREQRPREASSGRRPCASCRR